MFILSIGTANDRKRQSLMAAQGGRCRYCDRMLCTGQNELMPVLDHFLPSSRGGKRRDLVLACHWCDSAKGMMHGTDFLVLVQEAVVTFLSFKRAQPYIKRKAKAENRILQAKRQMVHPNTAGAQRVRPRQFSTMPSQRGI